MKFIVGLLTGCLAASTPASAGDYIVKYAVEFKERYEVGRVDACIYGKSCYIELHELKLTLHIRLNGMDDQRAFVGLDPNPYVLGCCYFRDGISTKFVDAREGAHRLAVYEGGARRGNEYVLNAKVGMLSFILAKP